MMETSTAILITQFPITIAILIGCIEIYRIRKEITRLVNRMIKKKL